MIQARVAMGEWRTNARGGGWGKSWLKSQSWDCPVASCGSGRHGHRGEDEAESKTSTKEPDETQDLGLKEKQR